MSYDRSGSVPYKANGNVPVSVEEGSVTLTTTDIEVGGVEIKNGTDDTRATVTPANALKVDGSGATQPVSISGTVPVSGSVSVSNLPATQPVSGSVSVSNFPATQPVSGTVTASGPLTDTQLRATAVPVSGTVTASGPLTDTQLRATAVPVSGTFFQATQPVSLATAPTTPVTGTFWQATQPVSGTVTANAGSGTFTVDSELPAAAALADTSANPTTPTVGALNSTFNGTNWDRLRGNFDTTTGDTGSKTASFAGATQTNYNALGAIITVKLGTVTGTSPTLTCQLQWSYDGGTSWLAIGTALANLTATGQLGTYIVYPANISSAAGSTPAALTTGATTTSYLNLSLPRLWRLNYTIGGSATPTFPITAVYVNYLL